jgi:flagellar basal-body rod protein FlgF
MENPIYIGLSRQIALQHDMDIVANNVANMSTPGYRGQNMVFSEYLAEPHNKDDQIRMVLDYGQFENTESGPLTQTGAPFDVALQGPGFFAVQTQQGTMYTRDGSFQISADGTLVTGSGDPVQGAGGGEIVIPKDARDVKIDRNGNVSTEQGQVGQIGIMEFANVQTLKQAGNGYYSADAPGAPAQNTAALQGMIEGSNVKPVVEMTRMVQILRNYQATQQMLENEHSRLRAMVQKLTRSS